MVTFVTVVRRDNVVSCEVYCMSTRDLEVCAMVFRDCDIKRLLIILGKT